MRVLRAITTIVGVSLLLVVTQGWEGTAPAAADAPVASTRPRITLSPVIPASPAFGSDDSLAARHADFDVFSWNSFIALNWPSGRDGSGDPNRQPGAGPTGDNPTVWEGYQEISGIFLPGGQVPTWGNHGEIPPVCRPFFKTGMRVLSQIGKTEALLSETVQPFDTGPLIDQRGGYAHFEILANRGMFEYILRNGLYSRAGQKSFTGLVRFPCGSRVQVGQVGALMIKAAWKLAEPGDAPGRFHRAEALIYTPSMTDPPAKESCSRQFVELVGFHIGHKVDVAPQWVWSTFEQVDNAPTVDDVESGKLKAHYNFYNPACRSCAVNTAPTRPWIPYQQATTPSQAVRMGILPKFAVTSAQARNGAAAALLATVSGKSVWQYYELISTQWPTDPGSGCIARSTAPNGNPAPAFLANTTLELYVQGSTANVSSSCIGCHGNAAMTTGAAADFTYMLQRAK
jgi:hypothetical protein